MLIKTVKFHGHIPDNISVRFQALLGPAILHEHLITFDTQLKTAQALFLRFCWLIVEIFIWHTPQFIITVFFFQVVKTATGKCAISMVNKTWDVGAFIGQRTRVRLVDFSSGGWGHINFDDLRGDISCGQNWDTVLLICCGMPCLIKQQEGMAKNRSRIQERKF